MLILTDQQAMQSARMLAALRDPIADAPRLQQLISRWQWQQRLHLITQNLLPSQPIHQLGFINNQLSWINSQQQRLSIDLMQPSLQYRLQHSSIKHELLARAIGLQRHRTTSPLKLIDATTGLGTDSWILAHLGVEVLMLERSPIIALLLADALERASEKASQHHLSLRLTDAKTILIDLASDYHVIYLDPMYPITPSSAKRKHRQTLNLVRAVVGDDADASELLQLAITHYHRTVVKRPLHAPVLAHCHPQSCCTGKSCRYDIYINNNMQ